MKIISLSLILFLFLFLIINAEDKRQSEKNHDITEFVDEEQQDTENTDVENRNKTKHYPHRKKFRDFDKGRKGKHRACIKHGRHHPRCKRVRHHHRHRKPWHHHKHRRYPPPRRPSFYSNKDETPYIRNKPKGTINTSFETEKVPSFNRNENNIDLTALAN